MENKKDGERTSIFLTPYNQSPIDDDVSYSLHHLPLGCGLPVIEPKETGVKFNEPMAIVHVKNPSIPDRKYAIKN